MSSGFTVCAGGIVEFQRWRGTGELYEVIMYRKSVNSPKVIVEGSIDINRPRTLGN